MAAVKPAAPKKIKPYAPNDPRRKWGLRPAGRRMLEQLEGEYTADLEKRAAERAAAAEQDN